jgi:hypothetical protein
MLRSHASPTMRLCSSIAACLPGRVPVELRGVPGLGGPAVAELQRFVADLLRGPLRVLAESPLAPGFREMPVLREPGSTIGLRGRGRGWRGRRDSDAGRCLRRGRDRRPFAALHRRWILFLLLFLASKGLRRGLLWRGLLMPVRRYVECLAVTLEKGAEKRVFRKPFVCLSNAYALLVSALKTVADLPCGHLVNEHHLGVFVITAKTSLDARLKALRSPFQPKPRFVGHVEDRLVVQPEHVGVRRADQVQADDDPFGAPFAQRLAGFAGPEARADLGVDAGAHAAFSPNVAPRECSKCRRSSLLSSIRLAA